MGINRSWLFRASVAGNLMLITYLALYSSSSSPPEPTVSPRFSRNLDFIESDGSSGVNNNNADEINSNNVGVGGGVASSNNNNNNNVKTEVKSDGGVVWDGDDSALGEGIAADLVSPPAGGQDKEVVPPPAVELVNETKPLENGGRLFPCDDLILRPYFAQRGAYWVLYNYIRGDKVFRCDQSITYTTHADFTFFDNLVPLLERWQGPLSLGVYAPGTDFSESLKRILYLRECVSPLVKDFVTFHIFFDSRHVPKSKVPQDPLAGAVNVNCSNVPAFGENMNTYRKQRRLPYPVNVARNVARETSMTQYVLASDIELYPNPNLITDFLEMIHLNDSNIQRPNPKVFVLSIFEVEANVTALPHDKRDLIRMLANKSAIPFHKYVCADCHRIPKAKEWLDASFTPGLRVFHVGKRHKPYHHWEPIYIGTKSDPIYDERLSWEGRSDKMTQGYVLCVLDYEFHILDNAFLVHRPGIKRNKIIPKKNPVVAKQNSLIARTILPELKLIYGTRPGCVV